MLGQTAMRLAAAGGQTRFRWYVLHITNRNHSISIGVQAFSLRLAGVWTPTNMTGLSTPEPYVASASHTYQNYWAFKAFDGVEEPGGTANTGWVTTRSPPVWLAIDMGSAVVATEWRMVPQIETGNRSPRDFTIRGSNTSATEDLVTLATVTGYTGSPNVITGPITPP